MTINETKNLNKPTTVFNDPPTVLVLRRKAIRMFPRGQSVATYRNDNYNIDLAIPYIPALLGTKHAIATSEGINEAMSAELKKIRKDRGMFKRDLSRQEDRFVTSKQRLDWAKRALAGHIKKHGKSLDAIGEEVIDELSRQTLGSYVKAASKDAAGHIDKANHYTPKPIKYHRDKAKKRLAGVERATGALTKEELEDDTIMEATIHSLHTINKTQSPAKIRFRDGSSAMIDHPTAAQIMHLHGKVNRLNKKKIESLINSGPMGIRKVSTFIKDHMKI